MFELFRKKGKSPSTGDTTTAQGLLQPASARVLLATPRRQKWLEHIWQRTSLSREQFARLYLSPLERYAELAQQFPASENHHHAYPGGMLDHGLEVVAYALKLRQSHLLPTGTIPEEQAAQAEVWTAGVAYAALLHDIGKLAVDLHVERADGSLWHPWHGPLQQPYRFRYREEREYRLHSAATGLIYHRLLDSQTLDWLSGYPALWSALLFVLSGQYEHAGVLGELVIQADQASVAQELGGNPSKVLSAPKHALQRKLLDGLRYLISEEFRLNQPQASDGWLTQDVLWLVSKTVSDKLRAHLLSQGIEGIPSNNTTLFTILQDHGIVLPTPEDKAIWKATVTSDNGWSHSFTFLKLSPALIWNSDNRPASFSGTVQVEAAAENEGETAPASPEMSSPYLSQDTPTAISTSAVDDLLQLIALPEDNPSEENTPALDSVNTKPASSLARNISPVTATEPTATHFIQWLKQHIQRHTLIMNDAKALVHTVNDTAYLVSPGVFQRYAREHPALAVIARKEQLQDWQWIQKQFEKLQLHRKHASGLNIWTCEVTGPRKSRRLHGYLLKDPLVILAEVPVNNPWLTVKE